MQTFKVTDKGFFFYSSYLFQFIIFTLLSLVVGGLIIHYWTSIYEHPGLLKYGLILIVYGLLKSLVHTGKNHLSGKLYMHWGADEDTLYFENDQVIGNEKLTWSQVNRCFLIDRLSGNSNRTISKAIVFDITIPSEGFKKYRAFKLLNLSKTAADYFQVSYSGASAKEVRALLEQFCPDQLSVFEIDMVYNLKELDEYVQEDS